MCYVKINNKKKYVGKYTPDICIVDIIKPLARCIACFLCQILTLKRTIVLN